MARPKRRRMTTMPTRRTGTRRHRCTPPRATAPGQSRRARHTAGKGPSGQSCTADSVRRMPPEEPVADPSLFDKVVNLCKRRGFVFPSAEIYGGFRSTYDYGPLGVLVLRNVKNAWWRSMVQLRDDIVGLD